MGKPRILSIDDEPSFTDLLKQYFEPRGYTIDIASEGKKGLEFLNSSDYDVVLLDLKMVGLDGLQVMKEIKKSGKDINVIFITAYSDSGETRDRLMAEGAYAYMEKPITSLKNLEDLVIEAADADKEEEK